MAVNIIPKDTSLESVQIIIRDFLKNHKHVLVTHDFHHDKTDSFTSYPLKAYSCYIVELCEDSGKKFIRVSLSGSTDDPYRVLIYTDSEVFIGNDFIIVKHKDVNSSDDKYLYELIQEDYTYFDDIGYNDPENPRPEGVKKISEAYDKWTEGDILGGMNFYSVLNDNLTAAHYMKYFKWSKSSNPFKSRFGTYACRYLCIKDKYDKTNELNKRWITMCFNAKHRVNQLKAMSNSGVCAKANEFVVYMGRDHIIFDNPQDIYDILGLTDELWDRSGIIEIYKISFDTKEFIRLRSHKPNYGWPGEHRLFALGSSLDIAGNTDDS